MSTINETTSKNQRNTLYAIVAVVLIVLLILGFFLYSSAKADQRAEDKANQLIAALEQAGATAPSQEQIVRVLGNDGGAVCENPNKALARSTLLSLLFNGAAGPGARPIIADSRVVKGQLLIASIYCPDELPELQKFVDDLKFDSVAGG